MKKSEHSQLQGVAMQTLDQFVQEWQAEYASAIKNIELFDLDRIRHLKLRQKQLFVRAFYHARGHFYRFLWFMGSLAPSAEFKKIILDNLDEEFGRDKKSHEQLYMEFAQGFEVSVRDEILTECANLPCTKAFNQGHIDWLISHGWDQRWAAFSAYERLDNVDYPNLYNVAVALGAQDRQLLFFQVHCAVQHYQEASPLLEEIWLRNPNAVRAGFDFIGQHQLRLWEGLSKAIFA